MPLFNENRWVALYFISFMVISFFFLMNVILAGVVNRYDTAMTQRKGEMIARANENLRRAFALMDPDGRGFIDRETVMGLFLIFNEDFPEFRTLSEEDTTLLFAVLDKVRRIERQIGLQGITDLTLRLRMAQISSRKLNLWTSAM